MALLQRVRMLPNQRLDLPDFNNLSEFVCADFKAIHKNVWTGGNFVVSGFQASGLGTDTLSLVLAGSVAILGENSGALYIGAPSLAPLSTSSLTPNEINYIELTIDQDTGGADSRAFWDQTANGGLGGEFSQIVDTFIFSKVNISISTNNFTGDPDKIRICEVTVDSNGDIQLIQDSRDLFWRLGRSNNTTYTHPWASRTEPPTTQFNGADKDLKTFKQWADAVMDSLREAKGTVHWYEDSIVAPPLAFQNSALSVLVGLTSSASMLWDGSALHIDDDAMTPNDADQLAAIRLFTDGADLVLTRQAGAQAIVLDDQEVLYITIPAPAANTVYDGVGALTTNFKISPRGSVPLTDQTYWLAFREGNRLYVRGLGELEAGEERQINDETTKTLQQLLGFNPETATSVPYTVTPDPSIFAQQFSSSDHLVEAISTNTFNINALGSAIQGNIYDEPVTVVSGPAANDNEIQGPVSIGTIITLPFDSRDGNTVEEYVVGRGILQLFLNGQYLQTGVDWLEVGAVDTLSDEVEINIPLVVDDVLSFRIGTLGGFSAGSGGGINAAVNVGTGENVFKQVAGSNLEFRRLLAGPGINITQVGDDLVISQSGSQDYNYFNNLITGQTSILIPTGADYNAGSNRLESYRNGILMVKSATISSAANRYIEKNDSNIEVGAAAISADVFSFVQNHDKPNYRIEMTGVSGTVLTLPSYVVGNDSLRVFRNGVLMNAAGLGSAVTQYTETSNTSITLGIAAVASDVFVLIYEDVPQYRQDSSGLTGTVLTIPTYAMGTGELLVYRNGVLMFNSNSLGSASDRYQETSTTSITLADAATAPEVFTFLRK
jgi:hypothetical protein